VTISRKTTTLICGVAMLAMSAPARAQSAPVPLMLGDVQATGSFRMRVESWNWFGDAPAGEYTYPGSLLRVGIAQSKKTIDWQAEVAVPFLLGLPTDAVAPGAQGALGLGANYYVANDNQPDAAQAFVKQATVRFKQLGGVPGQSLKIGRFEFIDGTETTPKDPTLAALKRERIAHRLLGTFSFAHVGRSFDGAQYGLSLDDWNVAALAVRPTRGVFDVNGWDDLDVNVLYGAVTRSTSRTGEWRLFGIGYDDYRHDAVKVDNRALASRRADRSNITIATFGGHYLQVIDTANGPLDLLLWGAGQSGSWGALSQRAGAISIEGGWQPHAPLAPWLRGGWDYGSGDGDPNDGVHGTFFQLLPTPRVYARLPFFNMMNTSDAFGEVVLRPKTFTLRGDVHAIRLATANDLWYQGGGAFQALTFGYTGRPSNGASSLARLADLSVDVPVSPHLAVSGYVGYAAGQPVTDAIYGGGGARLVYLELLVRM
jgi:alginate export protein